MRRNQPGERAFVMGAGRARRAAAVVRVAGALLTAALVAVAGWIGLAEIRTSRLQARLFAQLGEQVAVRVEPGPSDALLPAAGGPYDRRMGYADMAGFLRRLDAAGYRVTEQARASPQLARIARWGLFATYREKTRAGLELLDRHGQILYDVRYPQRVWDRFEAVPPLLVNALLWIENRELLQDDPPTRNPAVEWDRLGRAVHGQLLARIGAGGASAGGSTLATQMEKYRHSPEGRTASARDKLQQMVSASMRAYLDGEDTTAARRRIVLDYVNTVPLAARAGFGEVSGLGDGLWAWYGRDFDEVQRLLADGSPAPLAERSLAFKQALSLLVAQRRPSWYLGNAPALRALTDRYLRLLADAGVIDAGLRDAALAQPLAPGAHPVPGPVSYVEHKAANLMRTQLAQLLDTPRLYDLDRLDLIATGTLDARLQQEVGAVLRALGEPAAARPGGVLAGLLTGSGRPQDVVWSFTLVEAADDANRVRVQTDSLDRPIDVSQGTRLDLGSTAKLRTLVTYLEIVAELHARHAADRAAALRAPGSAALDPISHWAAQWLARCADCGLPAMLDAAMARRYSAGTGEAFFTGGGVHHFVNFNRSHDGRSMDLHEALRQSVNLPFVRLMRDIVRYEMRASLDYDPAQLLGDANAPRRTEYLTRFADREGQVYVTRFFRRYHGRTADQIEARLVQGMRPTPARLAAAFATLEPEADAQALAAFIGRHLPTAKLDADEVARLHAVHTAARMSLADRGYVARVHPLELCVARHLRRHPDASLAQVIALTEAERQAAYEWLFKTRRKATQDSRIRRLVEQDAFAAILRRWQRLGYPFASIVPSYATALGASGDRPTALADLMGVLVNDGRRLPTLRIESLHLARDTPWETRLDSAPGRGEQVLPADVARVARAALAEVVAQGTARRLSGTFVDARGRPVAIGGKTGTGDQRYDTYGRGGALISSHAVARSANFVFFLGERHFGMISAYVRGPAAARHEFTSALAIRAMQLLAPVLGQAIEPEAPVVPLQAQAAAG